MSQTPEHNVTRLLVDWRSGDSDALDALIPLVYKELRRIAAGHIRRESSAVSLQPTELINEAYIRMIDQSLPAFENRSHFFAVAARLMRQILVDFARRRTASKRKGEKVELNENSLVTADATENVLAVHQALLQLAATDERRARAIELCYFGGLNNSEIGEALGLSGATVKRDLALGEAQLGRILSEESKRAPAA